MERSTLLSTLSALLLVSSHFLTVFNAIPAASSFGNPNIPVAMQQKAWGDRKTGETVLREQEVVGGASVHIY